MRAVVVLTVMVGLGGLACARSGVAPLRDAAREKAAAAQRRFQQDVYDVLSSRRPDLKELAALERDLQLALIERQTRRFYFLLEHTPEAITRDRGVPAFLNFDWSDEDEQKLRAGNSEYVGLEERIDGLRSRVDGHAQWPEARIEMQSLQKGVAFQAAMNRLRDSFAEVDSLLISDGRRP